MSCRIDLQKEVRKAGKHPTSDQASKIRDNRQKLKEQIEQFRNQSRRFIPDHTGSLHYESVGLVDFEDFEDDPTALDPLGDPDPTDDEHDDNWLVGQQLAFEGDAALPIERQSIPLPSSFGKQNCARRLKELAAIELDLRIGQANDTLGLLRLAIGHKSFACRTKLRPGSSNSSYRNRLRSYADVHAITASVDQSAKVYMSCRLALDTLGASRDILSKFQILTKEHTAASTAVIDPNARGQRNNSLSWIWHSRNNSAGDPGWLDERNVIYSCETLSLLTNGH